VTFRHLVGSFVWELIHFIQSFNLRKYLWSKDKSLVRERSAGKKKKKEANEQAIVQLQNTHLLTLTPSIEKDPACRKSKAQAGSRSDHQNDTQYLHKPRRDVCEGSGWWGEVPKVNPVPTAFTSLPLRRWQCAASGCSACNVPRI